MRTALSLALTLISVASQAAAQQNEGLASIAPVVRAAAVMDGPIARTVTRDAARLGRDAPSGFVIHAPQCGSPAGSDWSCVRKLEPGTAISVRTKDSVVRVRYIVQADESTLALLNLSDPSLSAGAHDRLHDAAAKHGEDFLAAQQGGEYQFENNVRIGPAGVFVGGRKVSDLEHLVEQTSREELALIAVSHRQNALHGVIPNIGKGILTGFLGTFLFLAHNSTCSYHSDGCTVALEIGTVAGGVLGGVLGAHETVTRDVVIYRAEGFQ
jgi:hypothetical protein